MAYFARAQTNETEIFCGDAESQKACAELISVAEAHILSLNKVGVKRLVNKYLEKYFTGNQKLMLWPISFGGSIVQGTFEKTVDTLVAAGVYSGERHDLVHALHGFVLEKQQKVKAAA